MSIIGWLLLGLIAGFIASKLVNRSGEGVLLDIGLGIVGAVVGGFLFTFFGAAPVTGLNVYSLVVAVVGAVVVLFLYHAVCGRRALRCAPGCAFRVTLDHAGVVVFSIRSWTHSRPARVPAVSTTRKRSFMS